MERIPHLVRVRIWLSDRPGALGAVASRIGGVGGDVVGIEILERGGGRAVDDLVVALPDKSLIKLLVAEIQEVDGVDVEDVMPVAPGASEPDVTVLEAIPALVAQRDRGRLLAEATDLLMGTTEAHWVAVVDLTRPVGAAVLIRAGEAPPGEWLAAFAHGSHTSSLVASGQVGPDDIVAAPLDNAGFVLLVGREGHAFRERERKRCVALAQVVDVRLAELA